MTERRELTEADETAIRHARLAGLLAPFPPEAIGKLPRKTKSGGVFYLDYVGHAATTKRLLTADPEWTWEPVAYDSRGLPALDESGGLWIRLTVCDVTRLGYGDAQGKAGGDAVKELIGDAIRNAAMRFGNALDLWAKEDLSSIVDDGSAPAPRRRAAKKPKEDWGEKVEAPKTPVGVDGEDTTTGQPSDGVGDGDATVTLSSPSEGTSEEGPGTAHTAPAPPSDDALDDDPAAPWRWKDAAALGITGPQVLKRVRASFGKDRLSEAPNFQTEITNRQLAAVIAEQKS